MSIWSENQKRLDNVLEGVKIRRKGVVNIVADDHSNCEEEEVMENVAIMESRDEKVYVPTNGYVQENAITLKVTKGILAIVIITTLLIGIGLGMMISSIIYSNKMIDMKQEQINQSLQATNKIKEQSKEIAKINNINLDLQTKLESSIEEINSINEELETFKTRSELFDKYEYILMDSRGERTDITYDELEFGIKEMVKRNLNPHLLFGVIHLESKGTREATNSKSTARGYGQFLAGTGKWVYEGLLSRGKYNHDMAFNGYINLEMGAEYLSYLMTANKGSVLKSLISYNGGELGERYYHIINNTLKSKAGISLEQIEKEYKSQRKIS